MNPNTHQVMMAFSWAVGCGFLTWLLTIPMRRKSTALALTGVVLIASAASIGAMIGSFRSMLVSWGQLSLAVGITLVAGAIAGEAAWMTTQQLVRERAVLREALREIEQGRVPRTDGPKLSAELESLRTQLAETGRSLTQARERERAVERARRELLAFLSHDLRTPLAGLRAMSESLEDGVTESPDRYFKQIRVEVERLTTMVNDLFELSLIESGSLQLASETVVLEDIVSDCVATLTPIAQERRISLLGKAEGAATVVGDGYELNRAITNLIANAIRHTRPEGRIEVSVGVLQHHAAVVIRDECGGIPHDELARVFDVGFRGGTARTPPTNSDGGAGFGLAITRGIIEAHRGRIEVSNVAGGCSFTVHLPLSP